MQLVYWPPFDEAKGIMPRRAYLVAHHDIDYKRPLKFQDQPSIACHVAGVGDKSIEVGYRMECDGELVAEARTVLVCFDHEKQRTTSVPDAWKEAFDRAAQ